MKLSRVREGQQVEPRVLNIMMQFREAEIA